MWNFSIILFFLIGFEANSQSDVNGIYLTYTDFNNSALTNIFPSPPKYKQLNKEIWIGVTLDSIKQKNKNIWGVRVNQSDWRLYNGEFYKIDCSEKIIIYTLQGYVTYDSPIVYDRRYFSVDTSSPLFELNKKT